MNIGLLSKKLIKVKLIRYLYNTESFNLTCKWRELSWPYDMTHMSEDLVLIKRPEALYNTKEIRCLSILTTFNDYKKFNPGMVRCCGGSP